MKELVLDTLELIYDVFTAPRQTMERITSGFRLREGLLIWAFTLLLPCLSAGAQSERISAFSLAGVLMGGAIGLFLQIVCIHGAARLLGGQGAFKALASGLAFSDVPLNFATVAESLVFVLPSGLVHLISLAALLAALVFDVYAVHFTYGLSLGRSTAAVLLPIVLLLGLLVALIAFVFVGVVSTVTSL